MTTNEDKKDPNCWVCHKDGSTIFCSKCFLGFHLRCAEKLKEMINNSNKILMCHQCSKIERSHHLYTSSQKFKSVSKKVLNSIFDVILIRGGGIEPPPKIMRTKRDGRLFENVRHFINISAIESKIDKNEYGCTEELLFDLRKIEHVMKIEFRESSKTESIDHFMRQLSNYCQEIDLCPYCIYNHYLTPLGPATDCPWGHRSATVYQSRNYTASFGIFDTRRPPDLPRYFPVKVIAYSQCLSYVYVRLFEMNEPWSLKVPIKNLNHLSCSDLEQFHNSIHDTDLRFPFRGIAFEKLEIYMKGLKQKYGGRLFVPNQTCPWRSGDELFIHRELGVRAQQKIRLKRDELRNSKSDKNKCGKNQEAKKIRPTKDPINKERSLEIGDKNSSKEVEKEKTQPIVDNKTRSIDPSTETLPSGWSKQVAPHGRAYFINDSDGTISWIDPRTNKPGPLPSYTSLSAPNVARAGFPSPMDKKVVTDHAENEGQLKDPRSTKTRSELCPSHDMIHGSISDTELMDPLALSKDPPQKNHGSKNSEEIKSSRKCDVNEQTLLANSTLSIPLKNEAVKFLISPTSDHRCFNQGAKNPILAGNQSEGQLGENEPDKIISEPEIITIDDSPPRFSTDCESFTKNLFNEETEQRRPEAFSDSLAISTEKVYQSLNNTNNMEDQSGPLFEELESLPHALGLEPLDASHSQELKTAECLRCHLLEKELDKNKRIINYYDVNCKALMKYCSELKEELKKASN